MLLYPCVIWYILGTRPELVKAWPTVLQLRAESKPVLVVSTGQHRSLAEGMPLVSDVNLGVMGQDDPASKEEKQEEPVAAMNSSELRATLKRIIDLSDDSLNAPMVAFNPRIDQATGSQDDS